jgi:hypothetical protein
MQKSAPHTIIELPSKTKNRRGRMCLRESIAPIWDNIQYDLFPALESSYGALSKEYKQLAAILELVRIEEFLPHTTRNSWGRSARDRVAMSRAFIAKMVLKIPYTKHLVRALQGDRYLRVLCGWDPHSKIPSEAKFSRAFKEFAVMGLAERVHTSLVSEMYKDKIICHVVKDSMPLTVREKHNRKPGSAKERRKALNKQNHKDKKEGSSRKQKQLRQDPHTMIKELPSLCDIGAKKGSDGYQMMFRGYKLHAAVSDDCIPLSIIVTSASLNDSEAAIPLAGKAHQIATNLYDLMDSAYDSPEIIEHSRGLGHVPIIDKRSRTTSQKIEKEAERQRKRLLGAYTAQDKRYRERLPKERFNALYKDYFGGRNIFYKGYTKVFSHVMFGVLALTATLLLKLVQ